jgi:hypothetical protein
MALPNEAFLQKEFVDRNIKQLLEEDMIWEPYLSKQGTDSLVVLYYKEQYYDIETPNDAALGRTIDPEARTPQYRAEHSRFPHASAGIPKEYNLRLYQIALEMDYSEEEMKYADLENRVLKKQEKLANYFASYTNNLLGNTLTETWSTSPSAIQQVDVGSGDEWSLGPGDATVDPIKDIMSSIELIDDIAGYNYKPNVCITSKQSYYDLLLWFTAKDYAYSFEQPYTAKEILNVLGLKIVKSNMVKRDFAVVADFKSCGTLFEAEPVETRVYHMDETRDYHIQITRRFNFALTDPKAICTISNTVA